MKRLVNTVNLKFFADDAGMGWGMSHEETYDNNYGNGFNSFWDGLGIFHDVFEHYFEYRHKYFQGDHAANVGGEMAAMGHLWYYIFELGLSIRDANKGRYGFGDRDLGDSIMGVTRSYIQEAVQAGYCNYGYTLECAVPRQSPLDNELDYRLRQYYEQVKSWEFAEQYHNCEQERESAQNYKKSVTFQKIANLHRWGYRQAEKLVPNNMANQSTLHSFIEFWNEFTARHSAKELATDFKGISFRIYKDDDCIEWRSFLRGMPGATVDTEITRHFELIPQLFKEEFA